MEKEPTTAAAAADMDIRVEEETLLEAEEQPVTAEEETVPDVEERPAQEREADPTAAPQNIQVPGWNLEERIPIAPQEWDADTP
jgi:phosphoketolase